MDVGPKIRVIFPRPDGLSLILRAPKTYGRSFCCRTLHGIVYWTAKSSLSSGLISTILCAVWTTCSELPSCLLALLRKEHGVEFLIHDWQGSTPLHFTLCCRQVSHALYTLVRGADFIIMLGATQSTLSPRIFLIGITHLAGSRLTFSCGPEERFQRIQAQSGVGMVAIPDAR